MSFKQRIERDYPDAVRQLKKQCLDIETRIGNMHLEKVECEQPFNFVPQTLEEVRYNLLVGCGNVISEMAPVNRFLYEEYSNDRLRESLIEKQIEEMKILSEIQSQSVNNREKDTMLNKETKELFEEMLEVIEDKNDIEVEHSQSKMNLLEAKKNLKYILDKFYQEDQHDFLSILEKLEKSHAEGDSEEQWSDLSEFDLSPVLTLKRSMIIEQHTHNPEMYRLAPLS